MVAEVQGCKGFMNSPGAGPNFLSLELGFPCNPLKAKKGTL